jgi:CDP-paratose 2-epimerase
MKTVLITGCAGLIGSEATKFFLEKGFNVVGIDNNLRKNFFGEEASTEWKLKELEAYSAFKNYSVDIRCHTINNIFKEYSSDIVLVIHTAAQPSHDWAAKSPITDFSVNALGTLFLLEATQHYCPNAPFIFTSSNKVYGDTPNRLPIIELDTRWEIDKNHPYSIGIDESMSIDQTMHSVFGASKVAADIMVQEYGRYFKIKTVAFRGGCLTGPAHSGTMLHGFLSYMMKCAISKREYKIFGYKCKQVRDNIHSFDLVNAFWHFSQNPRIGEVYNIGGSRFSNCYLMEAMKLCEEITENKMQFVYSEEARIGDHIWWISNINKFKEHYPSWSLTTGIKDILLDIYKARND